MATLRAEEVIDNWSVLIGGANGKADEVFAATSELVKQTKAPNVHIERKQMSPGTLRGLLGTKRDFLILSERGNGRLRPFEMYINARDYGVNLAVDWHLTYRLTGLAKLAATLTAIPFLGLAFLPLAWVAGLAQRTRERRGSLDLDLFDQQDLLAYVTNAHHCLLEAVDDLMLSLKQDPSKIERRSRGFLGVS